MKFKCPKCKKIIFRYAKDYRNSSFITKTGKYRGYCDKFCCDVLMPRVKE